MTENEAKQWLKHTRAYQYKCDNCEYIDINGACNEECKDFYDMAIQALEEIQQYRAIGTVEEFGALKEKNVPKKPLRIPDDDTCIYYGYYCPCCNEPLSNTARMGRCFCGQKLDWS